MGGRLRKRSGANRGAKIWNGTATTRIVCRAGERFADRASAGTFFEGRDGEDLPAEPGIVPLTRRNEALMQLSGLGRDVQACGSRTLRRRRTVRPSAGAPLPPA